MIISFNTGFSVAAKIFSYISGSKSSSNSNRKIIPILIIFGFYLLKRKRGKKLKNFYFPNDKKKNFLHITSHVGYYQFIVEYKVHVASPVSAAKERKIPKIFLSDGFFPFNVKRIIVLSDYDIIQKAFKIPAMSARLTSAKVKLDFEQEREDLNVPAMIKSIGIETQLPGTNHIASGPYDSHHKMLRQRWHQTTSKLLGKNELDRMCNFASEQLNRQIQHEMENNPQGRVYSNLS